MRMQVHELEKAKRSLEQQLADQQTHMEELQDELQQSEDQRSRLEITLQAQKTEFERQLATREEAFEEGRKQLQRQLREQEVEMEEERKQRSTAVNAKKKQDGDFAEIAQQLDMSNRAKDDALKQLKKNQVRISFE